MSKIKVTNHAVSLLIVISVMRAIVPSSNVGAGTQQVDVAKQMIDYEPGTPFVVVTDASWAWETDSTSGDTSDEVSFPSWVTIPGAASIWSPECHGEQIATFTKAFEFPAGYKIGQSYLEVTVDDHVTSLLINDIEISLPEDLISGEKNWIKIQTLPIPTSVFNTSTQNTIAVTASNGNLGNCVQNPAGVALKLTFEGPIVFIGYPDFAPVDQRFSIDGLCPPPEFPNPYSANEMGWAFVDSNGCLPLAGIGDFELDEFETLRLIDVIPQNLALFDTAVLNLGSYGMACDPHSLTDEQLQSLVEFVFEGNKLVIYDSGCHEGIFPSGQDDRAAPPLDYSWLPDGIRFDVVMTSLDVDTQHTYTIHENNILSSDDPDDPHYVDVEPLMSESGHGANTMASYDLFWCIDIFVMDDTGIQGATHAYAQYGEGLIIYNGIPQVGQYGSDSLSTSLKALWTNELEAPISGSGLPCDPPAPDIAVTGIDFTTTPIAGVLNTAEAHLVNQGQVETGAFNVKWYLDGVEIGYWPHSSLAPGQVSNNEEFQDWMPTMGEHTLRFVADVDGDVTELNENNNSIDVTVNVQQPLPDLKANGIRFSSPPTPGVQTTAIATLANIGHADSGVFNVRWYLNDVQILGGSHASLAPGEISDGDESYLWTPTAEMHTLRVELDPLNDIAEYDDTNNTAEKTVDLRRPDLEVGGIDFLSTPIVGLQTTAIAHLVNQGQVETEVFNVKWYIDGTQVGYWAHEPLAPGEVSSGNVFFDWIPPTTGEHTLRYEADVDNHINELDETNNEREVIVDVQPGFFADDFDRPDSTDLGPEWEEITGDWQLANGELYASGGGSIVSLPCSTGLDCLPCPLGSGCLPTRIAGVGNRPATVGNRPREGSALPIEPPDDPIIILNTKQVLTNASFDVEQFTLEARIRMQEDTKVSGHGQAILSFGHAADGLGGYAVRYAPGDGMLSLIRVSDKSVLASTAVAHDLGSWRRLKVLRDGTNGLIEVYLDEGSGYPAAPQLQTDDTTYPTLGRLGLGISPTGFDLYTDWVLARPLAIPEPACLPPPPLPLIATPPFVNNGMVSLDIDDADDYAQGVALQPDGKIIVIGFSTHQTHGDTDFALARYLPNGTLDSSFDEDGIVLIDLALNQEARAVALQPDGKIVLAGYSQSDEDDYVIMLARFNADGSPDVGFGDDSVLPGIVRTEIDAGRDWAQAVTVLPDGKIIVAGRSSALADPRDYDAAVLRYNADGSLDTTFDPVGNDGMVTTPVGVLHDPIRGLAIQQDCKIIIAGYSNNGANDDVTLIRYLPDGSLDPSFGVTGIVTAEYGSGYAHDHSYAVALQLDGKIIVAGRSKQGENWDIVLMRFASDGSLDSSFGTDGKVKTAFSPSASPEAATALALQPDGKIVVAGFINTGTSNDFAVLRYLSNGNLDPSFGGDGIVTIPFFGPDADENAYGIVIQPDGKIVIVGEAYNDQDFFGNLDWDFAIVRLKPDGSMDG